MKCISNTRLLEVMVLCVEKLTFIIKQIGMKKVLFFILMFLFIGGNQQRAAAGDHHIKVMTRNLYVGADVLRILNAPLDSIPLSVAQAYEMIIHNNFHERAQALAIEISEKDPDLIGLQEVSLIRRQSPSDFLVPDGTGGFIIGNPFPNATDEDLDYSEILMAALQDRGLDYYVAAVQDSTDVELPTYVFDETGVLIGIDDLRLTQRNVILSRRNIRTSAYINQIFEKNLKFDFPLYPGVSLPIDFHRGFIAVNAEVKGKTYRFVNAHLEVRGEEMGPLVPAIQSAQASELMIALSLSEENFPVILVGDLNSSPMHQPIWIDSHPIPTPYQILTAGDYVDVWTVRSNRGNLFSSGFTCCQDEDLLNERSNLTERIDHLFVLNNNDPSSSFILNPVICNLTGDDPVEDKTDSGLWPSDHAGVFAVLKFADLNE